MRVRIFNANASSLAGELPVNESLPQIWVVDPADAERGREVVAAYFRAVPSGPPRPCPHCGEEIPATFELCWNCGK